MNRGSSKKEPGARDKQLSGSEMKRGPQYNSFTPLVASHGQVLLEI